MRTLGRRSRTLGPAAVVLASTLLLAGCGAGEDDGDRRTTSAEETPAEETTDPVPTTSAPTAAPDSTASVFPPCAEVWAPGAVLDELYEGCRGQRGRVVAIPRYCESGQAIASFGNAYYAVPGQKVNGPIENLRDDQDYRRQLRSCGG